jgi:hypothetical protein
VGLAGSNAPVNCGGALDKIIQFRDDLVAQRGCVTFGSWEDTNGTTPFVALYLCAPWRAWTVRRAQPPREATNVASFFYFIRRLPSRK